MSSLLDTLQEVTEARPEQGSELDTFKQLAERSTRLPLPFPTKYNRIELLGLNDWARQATIGSHARQAGVILHHKVRALIGVFLYVKRKFGSHREKALYSTLTENSLISRLFSKRAFCFPKLDCNGTRRHIYDFPLSDYISHDEMQLAALLGVSTPTLFINDGNQFNRGLPILPSRGKYFEEGVVVSLSGPRFDLPHYFDWQHMIVDESWTVANGYGLEGDVLDVFEAKLLEEEEEEENEKEAIPPANPNEGEPKRKKIKTSSLQEIDTHNSLMRRIWADFYNNFNGGKDRGFFPTYGNVLAEAGTAGNERYVPIPSLTRSHGSFGRPVYLDVVMYRTRVRLLAQTLLLEANEAGKNAGKSVYLRVFPFGLEKLRITRKQYDWIFCEFLSALHLLDLPNIAVVSFSKFPPAILAPLAGRTFIHNGEHQHEIKIKALDAGAAGMDPEFPDCLLVTGYPCSVDSLPGKEYWAYRPKDSFESAIACASTIPQLLNPFINKFFENIKDLH